MLYSELRHKEVINLRDCNKLGYVCDLEIDRCSGCICKIHVSKGRMFLPFFHCEEEIIINYKDIKKIGEDIICVDLC